MLGSLEKVPTLAARLAVLVLDCPHLFAHRFFFEME